MTDNLGDVAGGALFSFALVHLVTPLQAVLVANLPLLALGWYLPAPGRRFRPASLLAASAALGLLVAGVLGERRSLATGEAELVHYQESRHGRITVFKDREQYTLFSDGAPVLSTQNQARRGGRPLPPLAAGQDRGHPARLGRGRHARRGRKIPAGPRRLRGAGPGHERRPVFVRPAAQDSRARGRQRGRPPVAPPARPGPTTRSSSTCGSRRPFRQTASSRTASSRWPKAAWPRAASSPSAWKGSTATWPNPSAGSSRSSTPRWPGTSRTSCCCRGRARCSSAATSRSTRHPGAPAGEGDRRRLHQRLLRRRRHPRAHRAAQRPAHRGFAREPGRVAPPDARHVLPVVRQIRHLAGLVRGGPVRLAALYLSRLRRAEFVLFTTGATAMGAEVLVIFAFQIYFGYIYLEIGLIVTVFLAGLLPGAWLGNRLSGRGRRVLIATDLLLILLLAAFVLALQPGRRPAAGGLLPRLRVRRVARLRLPVSRGAAARGRRQPGCGARLFGRPVGAACGTLATSVVLIPWLGPLPGGPVPDRLEIREPRARGGDP